MKKKVKKKGLLYTYVLVNLQADNSWDKPIVRKPKFQGQ